jgi:hypothetical protein
VVARDDRFKFRHRGHLLLWTPRVERRRPGARRAPDLLRAGDALYAVGQKNSPHARVAVRSAFVVARPKNEKLKAHPPKNDFEVRIARELGNHSIAIDPFNIE